jgi:hypothetical protein
MRPALALLPVALLTVATAGCGSDPVEVTPAAPKASATPSPSPTPSPSKPGKPGLGILPAAKDGRNFDACADGRCEVKVKPGDDIAFTEKSLEIEAMKVTKVADGKVTYSMSGPEFKRPWVVKNQGAGEPFFVRNAKIVVVVVQNETAILRLEATA